MRKPGQVTAEPQEGAVDVRSVALALVILLYTILWLVAEFTGTFAWVRGELRPYLPASFLLINVLLTPVTGALSGLRSLSFKTNLVFFLVLTLQLALLGLTAEKYPVAKGLVTIFLYYETFALIPKWNRRILERGTDSSILHL